VIHPLAVAHRGRQVQWAEVPAAVEGLVGELRLVLGRRAPETTSQKAMENMENAGEMKVKSWNINGKYGKCRGNEGEIVEKSWNINGKSMEFRMVK